MDNRNCKFCDKKGLLILPLRYAAVVGDGDLSLPSLPGSLGKGVSDIGLTHGKYAPRLLREGFLYILVERLGIKYWEGYAVLEDAFLYQFPVDTPPSSKMEFSCDRNTCGVNASCVSIDRVDDVTQVYLLFTPSAMSISKLDEYKANAEAFAANGKMQSFNPKAWVRGGVHNQRHSLEPWLLDQHVPEWLLYNQHAAALSSSLGVAMQRQMFPAISAAYAGTPAAAPDQPSPGRLGMLQHKLTQTKGAAFAVFDHIGITQELNDFRNAALEGVEHYLAATDTYGASNQQRLQVYEAIKELEAGFKKGVVQSSQRFVELHRQSSDQFFERQLSTARQLRTMGRNDDAQRVEDEVARSLQVRQRHYAQTIEEEKARADATWISKYESRLDTVEMKAFHDTLRAHMTKAFAAIDARSVQHLRWFVSDRLVDAFDTFDAKHAGSGYAFAVQSAVCTFGLSGCKLAEDRLDEWIKAGEVTRKNLYMRGFFYNQDELIAAARQANQEIVGAVGSVEAASDIDGALMIKATKGLVDGFKKVDSAFDEWVRNQGQAFSRKWANGIEIVVYHKASDMTRAVFRTGLGGSFDKVLTARISGLLYAKLRAVSKSLAYDEIMLTLPKEKVAAHRRERAERRAEQRRADKATDKARKLVAQVDDSLETLIADAQAKAKVSPSLNELKGNKNPPTNNYHQTRIGVVLGCIEMIALGEKLTHFENNTKGWLEVGGSALAVGSIVLDTYYSAAKSIREIEPYRSVNAINKGADIVRGGFKLGAGVLGFGAGACSAYLDYLKIGETNDAVLKGIYGVRFLVSGISAGLTMAAAFSYTKPLLEHMAKGYAHHSVRSRALTTTAGVAGKLAARVRLLVWVARLNVAGLALTVAEIGYLYFKDDDLQAWCEKSVFRKDKVNSNWLGRRVETDGFSGAAKELEGLERAAQVVGIGG